MQDNTPAHPSQVDITPDEAKASLGIASRLQMQHVMPMVAPKPTQSAPTSSQQPNPAPEPPTNQETGTDLKAEMTGLEQRIFDEIGVLKSEIQKAQPKDSGKELQDLKNQIEQVLASND